MDKPIICCLRTAVELKSIGLALVTKEFFCPKENLVVAFGDIDKYEAKELFPVLSFDEAIKFLWDNGYSVGLKISSGWAWVDDTFNTFEFRVENPENYDMYNEADLLANIIMNIIKDEPEHLKLLNTWLRNNTNISVTTTIINNISPKQIKE